MNGMPAYGLWSLVIINSVVFIIFAFSFVRPQSSRDWRSFGAFSAFILALFTEMYGFPLTIYLLPGWLASRYPQLNLYAHDSGHLATMYALLARREERDALAEFGDEYRRYMARTPAFFPRLRPTRQTEGKA